jgi:alpha-L-glutamate ligase-like protein
VRANARKVLSMNARNLHYIYPNNPRKHFPLADDKQLTKTLLQDAGVPVSPTLATYGYFYELRNLAADLSRWKEFVIKPANGSGGGGIVVITDFQNGEWISISGEHYTEQDLRKHISDVIFGIYSFGLHDTAIIEARIEQHPGLSALSPHGLADIRLIMCRHRPVLSMLRLTTRQSHGKANLHQGAVGVGVDVKTGVTRHAILKGHAISTHPDSGAALVGYAVPHWPEVLDIGQRIAHAMPLKYLGVDIALATDGPRVLEVNVRPGIEIQNANAIGMRAILEQLEGAA